MAPKLLGQTSWGHLRILQTWPIRNGPFLGQAKKTSVSRPKSHKEESGGGGGGGCFFLFYHFPLLYYFQLNAYFTHYYPFRGSKWSS